MGATLAAVGSVIGDKTLSLVGGAIGAVGAIGGLASASGLLGAGTASGAPIFGPAPAATTGAAFDATNAANTFAEGLTPATSGTAEGAIDAGGWSGTAADAASAGTIPMVASGTVPGQDGLYTFSDVAKDASTPTVDAAVNPAANLGGTPPTGNINPATGLSENAPFGADVKIGNNDLGIAPNTPLTPSQPPNNFGSVDPSSGQVITSAVDAKTGQIVSLPDQASGVFGQVLDFAKKNPTLAAGALTVGGKLLEGMTSTLTPAQVDALQAQAAANNAAAALTRQQTANLAMPKAVASSTPVTGTPGPIVPTGGFGQPGGIGIINRPSPPVTGAPA